MSGCWSWEAVSVHSLLFVLKGDRTKSSRETSILLLGLCFVIGTYGNPKDVFSKQMCREDGDCSFQVGGIKGVCQVLNTKACREFLMDQWTTVPVQHIQTEDTASFRASILPYRWAIPGIPMDVELAINISLSSFSKDINGFQLNISENVPSSRTNWCRIFDFREAARQKHRKFSVFYDCFHSLGKNGVYSYLVSVRSLPINEEMQYLMYMPNAKAVEPDALCLWKPLILVFLPSLKVGIVNFKFSKAPASFDAREYEISLIAEEPEKQTVVDSLSLDADSDDEMLHAEFHHVDIGYYHLHVTPLSWKERCQGTPSGTIFVSSERQDVAIAYISGIAISVVIFLMLCLSLIRWMFMPKTMTFVPMVLLVHSYNCDEDESAVHCLKRVLEHFRWKVSTIYGTGNPTHWLEERCKEATAIVIVLSPTAFHKLQYNNNPPCPETHPWRDQFSPAIRFLEQMFFYDEPSSSTRDKKVAKVFFEYSGKHHIPRRLEHGWGKTFALPDQVGKFLCYLGNQQPRIPCFAPCAPSFEHITSFTEGEELISAIKRAQVVMCKGKNGITTSDKQTKEQANAEIPTSFRDLGPPSDKRKVAEAQESIM